MSTKETYTLGIVPADTMHGEGERVLEIETTKYNGQIITRANVSVNSKSERGYSVRTFEAFGDFSKTLQRIPAKPITQSKLKAAHKAVKHLFPAVVAEAKAFYAKQAEMANNG